MRRWPFTAVVLAVLWLFVRGVELTPTRLAEEFVIGLLIGLPLSFTVRRFYADTFPVERRLRVLPYGFLYVLSFAWELLTANVDVAKRVLLPSMPIDPAVVQVPLRVRSDAAITTIANSITLTPGTLTMDYDADTNTLYVHSIDGSDPEAVLEPIRNWEDYALVIFEEDLDPEDAVPARPGSGGGAGDGATDDGASGGTVGGRIDGDTEPTDADRGEHE